MKEKNEKDFIPILKAHGLKVTFQRLAIYQALILTNGEHPSVDFIYQHTKKSFPMISLGTVYKTLDKFCEVGLIQNLNNTWRLEYTAAFDQGPSREGHFSLNVQFDVIRF